MTRRWPRGSLAGYLGENDRGLSVRWEDRHDGEQIVRESGKRLEGVRQEVEDGTSVPSLALYTTLLAHSSYWVAPSGAETAVL